MHEPTSAPAPPPFATQCSWGHRTCPSGTGSRGFGSLGGLCREQSADQHSPVKPSAAQPSRVLHGPVSFFMDQHSPVKPSTVQLFPAQSSMILHGPAQPSTARCSPAWPSRAGTSTSPRCPARSSTARTARPELPRFPRAPAATGGRRAPPAGTRAGPGTRERITARGTAGTRRGQPTGHAGPAQQGPGGERCRCAQLRASVSPSLSRQRARERQRSRTGADAGLAAVPSPRACGVPLGCSGPFLAGTGCS